MRKWEYDVTEQNEWEPGMWQEGDYLNDAGKEGWELCSTMTMYENNPEIRTAYIYYWKREITR